MSPSWCFRPSSDCVTSWGQGLARGRQLQVPTPPPAVHCFPLSFAIPALVYLVLGILLLSLWVKLGESLRFAQRSLHCPGGTSVWKRLLRLFPKACRGFRASVAAVLVGASPVLLPYRPVKKITVERSYYREAVKHKSQKWWWPHSTSAILKAIEETWLCLVTFLDLLFKWSIVFKCRKSTFSEDLFFFFPPWKPVQFHKRKWENDRSHVRMFPIRSLPFYICLLSSMDSNLNITYLEKLSVAEGQ